MKKYYLFIINTNTYKIYKNNPKYLYEILNTLYHLKMTNLDYGLSLYNSICDTFSVKLLNNYIKERFNTRTYNKKIKINKEKTYINLRYSCIIIESNNLDSSIFKVLNIYNKKIFIINFKEKEYMWLNDKISKR